MLRSESDHPFYRPLWVRIALTAVVIGWSVLEWTHGEAFWGVLTAAASAWAIWTFFLGYDPDAANGTREAAARGIRRGAERDAQDRERVTAMSHLLVRPKREHGRVIHVTPESAGWTYVGFELYRLEPGAGLAERTHDREVCLVLVSGKASIATEFEDFGVVGERMSPFEGKPWSVYVPAGDRFHVTAETKVELAVCSAPGVRGAHPPRLIAPDSLGQETRGQGTNVRHVTNILPETDKGADSLLVVEVITPGGHTSSYPPHKHDTDNLPARVRSRGDLLPPARPAAGFRLPARLHRRAAGRHARDRSGDGGSRRRHDAGAEGLPSLRRDARLRPLLSERDGWSGADVEVPQRAGARLAGEALDGVLPRADPPSPANL